VGAVFADLANVVFFMRQYPSSHSGRPMLCSLLAYAFRLYLHSNGTPASEVLRDGR
jgi:hypothetical protein